MEALDFAMQMEKDGERYYRELAQKTPDTGVAGILTTLANVEVKHYNLFKQMKESSPPQLTHGTLRGDVKNLFARMIEAGESFDFGSDEVALYEKAQDLERQSKEFYTKQAEELESPEGREIFCKLADEEQLHFLILESIIEFVSRPVAGNWLENAEWFHSDEY